MNRKWCAFHLKEATEQLLKSIAALETDESYSDAAYQVDIEHAYHHLNTAWNARQAKDEQLVECTDRDFQTWRKFPTNLKLYGSQDNFED